MHRRLPCSGSCPQLKQQGKRFVCALKGEFFGSEGGCIQIRLARLVVPAGIRLLFAQLDGRGRKRQACAAARTLPRLAGLARAVTKFPAAGRAQEMVVRLLLGAAWSREPVRSDRQYSPSAQEEYQHQCAHDYPKATMPATPEQADSQWRTKVVSLRSRPGA